MWSVRNRYLPPDQRVMPIVFAQHLRKGRLIATREILVKRLCDVCEQRGHVEVNAGDRV
jgi:hypothetical protein